VVRSIGARSAVRGAQTARHSQQLDGRWLADGGRAVVGKVAGKCEKEWECETE